MLYWIHARILYWLLSCPLYWLNCPKHVLAYVAHACALAHRVWPAAQESSPGMLSLGSPPNLGSGDNNLVQKSANCQFLHTFHSLATSFRPSPFIESIVLFPLSPFLDTHRPLPSRAANKHLALCSEAAQSYPPSWCTEKEKITSPQPIVTVAISTPFFFKLESYFFFAWIRMELFSLAILHPPK